MAAKPLPAIPDPMMPTPDNPGLLIQDRAYPGPGAVYACGCGRVRRGRGADMVPKIVEAHREHKSACGGKGAAADGR